MEGTNYDRTGLAFKKVSKDWRNTCKNKLKKGRGDAIQESIGITKFKNKDWLATQVFLTKGCRDYSGIQVKKSRCEDIAFR